MDAIKHLLAKLSILNLMPSKPISLLNKGPLAPNKRLRSLTQCVVLKGLILLGTFAHGQDQDIVEEGEHKQATLRLWQDRLQECRSHTPKTWVITRLASAQTQLPEVLLPDQVSFLTEASSGGLTPTRLEEEGPAGGPGQPSAQTGWPRADVLAQLAAQLKAHPCPVEVSGFASVEGSLVQNLSLARDRRNGLIAALTARGVSPVQIHQGSAEVISSFTSLAENRQIVVRTAPELRWNCGFLPGSAQVFPVRAVWHLINPDQPSEEELQAGQDLWKILAPHLRSYPCRALAHIQGPPTQEQPARALVQAVQGSSTEEALQISFQIQQFEGDTTQILFGVPIEVFEQGAQSELSAPEEGR